MDILAYLAIAVIAYLLGSISTGMLVSKAMGGPDLHKVGSGNTGATNALRTMGKKGGAIVFAGDVVKALLACLVGRLWMGQNGALLAGLFVILGHNWPVFFGFKGGKGVSSTCGVMLMTFWWQALICYVITIALIAITKFVSLGSLALVVLFGILVTATNWGNWLVIAWVWVIAGLCIYRHHANIGRLMNLSHYYFVPMFQDDCSAKPRSLTADFSQVPAAVRSALMGRQMQPIFCK